MNRIKMSIMYAVFYSVISIGYAILMLNSRSYGGIIVLVASLMVQILIVHKKQKYDEYQLYKASEKTFFNFIFLAILMLVMFGFIFYSQYEIRSIILVFMVMHWSIMTFLELFFVFKVTNN